MTLSEVVNRLKILEVEVKTLSALLKPQSPPPHFEFVIQVDGCEMWNGMDLSKHYPEIRREYPDAQISIGWHSSPVVLI